MSNDHFITLPLHNKSYHEGGGRVKRPQKFNLEVYGWPLRPLILNADDLINHNNFLVSLFQVCPPTSEYPRVFSESDLEENGCTFPEALKTIEEKCHGQEACQMVTGKSL